MAIKRYLHYFQTKNDFNNERGRNYKEPWTSFTVETRDVDYNKTEEEKLLSTPFTVEALETGDITWNLGNLTVKYSKNGGSWQTMTSATTIPVVQGDEVAFKGENSAYSYYDDDEGDWMSRNFSSTARINVKGNIMSLTDGDDFVTATSLNDYAFLRLFNSQYDETGAPIVSAEHLILPVTELSEACYSGMFMLCDNLISAPKLPALVLADYCYDSMFQECTSLTTAPDLPATTLEISCYGNMFLYCSSLVKAPDLPATNLKTYCYALMFQGCTSLTTPPAISATTLAESCYSSMFRGCTSLAMAPPLPVTTLAKNCYQYMFRECTSLEESPVLPATTLVNGCYSSMFSGCSNLKRIEAMFTTTPSNTYTSSWVTGVSPTGTFVKNASASWTTTGTNAVPSGWTIETK